LARPFSEKRNYFLKKIVFMLILRPKKRKSMNKVNLTAVISAIILLFSGLPFEAISQNLHDHHLFCGYDHSPEELKRLEQNIERIKHLAILRSDGSYYVPIKFHSINRNDGGGGIRPNEVVQQMCILNSNFAPYDIQFFLKDQDINYIFNNAAFNNPTAATAILLSNRDNRAMDVFWAQNTTSGGGGFGVTLGYYSPMQDWIVMRNDQINSGFTLAHEIGHFFSLQHTFLGWEPQPWDESIHGNPVMQVTAPDGIERVELANGSNCGLAADRICDTPPDYNFGFGWQAGGGCGPFDIDVRDRNNDQVIPMQDNYMGYFFNCGSYEFTPTQADVMKADFLSARRNYLRNGFGVPSSGQISESPTPIYPLNGAKSDYFDEVVLQWTAPENATYYVLEVGTLPNLNPGNLIIHEFVSNPEIVLTGLEPDRNYFWRVRPLNDLNYCAPRSSVYSFSTSDISVDVSDFEPTGFEANIVPNPGNSLGKTNVIMTNHFGFQKGTLSIFSIDGRHISSREIEIPEGRSSLRLHESLVPGMYFVKINSGFIEQTLPLILH